MAVNVAAANAAAAKAVAAVARPTGAPHSDGSGGGRVQRLGRFTVVQTNGPNDDESLDCDSTHTPDNVSQCADRPEVAGMNLVDVHSFLELKHKEIGRLFDKMRAQIYEVMVGPGVPAGTPPAIALAMPSAASSSSSAAAGSTTAGTSHSSARTVPRPVAAAPAEVLAPVVAGHDEAIDLWEALGKPIERATKRNRHLEEENKRLKRELGLKERELQELQRRLQAASLSHPLQVPGLSSPLAASSATASPLASASAALAPSASSSSVAPAPQPFVRSTSSNANGFAMPGSHSGPPVLVLPPAGSAKVGPDYVPATVLSPVASVGPPSIAAHASTPSFGFETPGAFSKRPKMQSRSPEAGAGSSQVFSAPWRVSEASTPPTPLVSKCSAGSSSAGPVTGAAWPGLDAREVDARGAPVSSPSQPPRAGASATEPWPEDSSVQLDLLRSEPLSTNSRPNEALRPEDESYISPSMFHRFPSAT